MIYTILDIQLGKMTVALNKNGSVAGLWFENQKHFPKMPSDAIWLERSLMKEKLKTTMEKLEEQLRAYEKGVLKVFDLKLEPVGTEFQKLVWLCLNEIPYGETVTYGDIGKKVAKIMKRKSMSAQAVGNAVGRNPISIIIPCHRVIGRDGSLTGYAGGLERKRSLLNIEGIYVEEQLEMDLPLNL
ncbi:MAG: methylated-DNA--[protein]-cysteine S-methyltransferase [Clostridiales bacterium]|nr:methylated-DNA--[protein]-cysteine S-methyltransferase [Clostridiales bacterium]